MPVLTAPSPLKSFPRIPGTWSKAGIESRPWSDLLSNPLSKFLPRARIVLLKDILHGVNHHAGADCDQQNVSGNPDIAVIEGRYRQPYHQFIRQVVIFVPERIPFFPFFCLPRRLTAAAFFLNLVSLGFLILAVSWRDRLIRKGAVHCQGQKNADQS